MIELDFKKGDGLLPAIVQDYRTNEVLMLGYINKESWAETIRSGYATYWSRSRNELWKKGDTSGNLQEIKEILVDCDNDTVIFKVNQIGDAACHKGYRSCFYRKIDGTVVSRLIFDPKEVYKK